MKRTSLYLAMTAAIAVLAVLPAQAQDKAPPAKGQAPAAAAAAPAAGSTKELYPKIYADYLLKERMAQGQPDTPELRNAIRDELNTRELLVREARKQGVDKNPAVKTEMDLTSQTVLVRAYMADYLKSHPVPEDQMRKEYDVIKG